MADREFLESLFGLDGKVALVTGASGGLGARFARVLARAGATVLLAARREDRLRALVDEIAAGGGRAEALCLDVTDEEAVRKAFETADSRFGGVDVLVNNAGIARMSPIVEMSSADWDSVIDVNLRAVFLVAREAARRMVARGQGGVIVNIASILGERVARQVGAYAASKAAAIQLTRTMAIELARHNVRVNALAPGYILTDINRDFFGSEAGGKMMKSFPMRRAGGEEELDAALLMLAGAGASYVTGSVVTVDGGQSLPLV